MSQKLIQCKTCDNMISPRAIACPSCGEPRLTKNKITRSPKNSKMNILKKGIFNLILTLLFALFFLKVLMPYVQNYLQSNLSFMKH